MKERRYTVREIDELRACCFNKLSRGAYWGNTGVLLKSSGDRVKDVEEMVRTHMLAGHTAQDLIESCSPPKA